MKSRLSAPFRKSGGDLGGDLPFDGVGYSAATAIV